MADSAIPAWLTSLPLAPEYHPTETEFADPITFISRIERAAGAAGICKIIPPHPRPSKRHVLSNLHRSIPAVFTTRHQELGSRRRAFPPPVHKQVWQSGESYTLEQFEAKSRAFARTHLAGHKDISSLLIESLFWKATLERPIYVEYANDVPGSGFSPPGSEPGRRLSNSHWNLQAIARAPGSLTRFMPDDVQGVTSPMVYIGMLFSWFAWHVEDHDLHSMNFLHTGAPKTWYAVPAEYASKLEEIVRVQGYGGNVDRLEGFCMLGEKTTLLSPEILKASGVPCCRLVQYPGEYVVTFPRAYHVGFSHGCNSSSSCNVNSLPEWAMSSSRQAIRGNLYDGEMLLACKIGQESRN